ncbi:hypothetical protein ACHQM5_023318 [Ranunculus cassubicifolius]
MITKIPTNLPTHLCHKFLKIYLNSGDLKSARSMFDKIPEPDLPTWTILITAHNKQGYPKESIQLYTELRRRNIQPDSLVLLSVVKACAGLMDSGIAKEIHEDAVRFGFGNDLVLGNALIDMYGKCRLFEGGRKVFDEMVRKDVVSWTSMVACCVKCGLLRDALVVFREMGVNGVRANSMTVSSVLPACSSLKYLKSGKEIHGFVIRNGMGGNVYVSSGLVDMYANCLRIREAQVVFDGMSQRDSVSWNVILTSYFSNGECEKALNMFHEMRREMVKLNSATWNSMIGGCMQNGRTKQALDLLVEMQDCGFKPNHITISSVLPACIDIESSKGGKQIHGYSVRHLFTKDLMVGTALVLMYAKCGDLNFSQRVFSNLMRRDTVAWNTIILANSMHGNGEEALSLFRKMIDSGIKPNAVTFTGVLSGCSHSRLVDEAYFIMKSMHKDHNIQPDVDHYSCMVDVLSRAGRLEEAYDFIQKMPCIPTASAWGALLGACRVYKNVDLGRIAAEKLFSIEPDNPGNYVLLSNILVTSKQWDDASRIRVLMRDKGITKLPGISWVQVKNKIHSFSAGDKRNDQSDKIYEFLEVLGEKMKLAGYQPNTDFVLQDVDQEEKEEVLCSHSEKLAVAFGILNLSGASSIRVFKNLRVCGDCHSAIKFMSKIVGVQIILRDSLRFHHFRDGSCSCRDFW